MTIATWIDENGQKLWQELNTAAEIEWNRSRGRIIVYVDFTADGRAIVEA